MTATAQKEEGRENEEKYRADARGNDFRKGIVMGKIVRKLRVSENRKKIINIEKVLKKSEATCSST